jgi:hypothetical protein
MPFSEISGSSDSATKPTACPSRTEAAYWADTRFLRADLSSLEEVRDAGARLAAEGPLQVLVNSVGGMFSTRWETVDGIEAVSR